MTAGWCFLPAETANELVGWMRAKTVAMADSADSRERLDVAEFLSIPRGDQFTRLSPIF
jgi:hypothetical protein